MKIYGKISFSCFSCKHGGSDLLQNCSGFSSKTMKTLQIEWPENHCLLQNIRLHYKTHGCTPDVCTTSKKNYEKLVCTRPKPTLFRIGNCKGDAKSDSMRQAQHSHKARARDTIPIPMHDVQVGKPLVGNLFAY